MREGAFRPERNRELLSLVREGDAEVSARALEELVKQAGGNVVSRMAILAEGDATERDDLIYLEKLPLFDKNGNPL